MPMFLYHFLWTAVLGFLAPVIWLLRMSSVGRRRGGLDARLGARLVWRPPDISLHKGPLWIHALSVGEVMSAVSLVERLKGAYLDREIVFTATTAAGLAVAREKLGDKVRLLFPMPLDAWWNVRRVVGFVRPSVFILIETDIWPGLLGWLRRKRVPSLLVNGRVSPRTFRSYRKMPRVVRAMFRPLCACLMQSDLDRDRLVRAGVDRQKVIATGNIKFDRQMNGITEGERHTWLQGLGLGPECPVWVAGSTHEGEEELILDAYRRLVGLFPDLCLILAPRDPKRSPEIVALAGEKGLRARLKTQISGEDAGGGPFGSEVVVLDTIGELDRLYGLGKACFVGGSLVPVGGHNLLEPAGFGLPVLFGPHTHNFVSMVSGLLEGGGGRRVQNGEDLFREVAAFLRDEGLRVNVGAKARAFVEANRGAIEKVLFHVRRCMEEPGV